MGCNAWNHSADCDCGWGGDTRSGTGGSPVYLSSSLLNSFSTAQTQDAKTYQTECWWCGEKVYYHTNGYGDSVLFNSLGWPWEIHECWEDHKQQQNNETHISKHYFDNLNNKQQKCLVLAGTIQKLKDEHYLATEQNVANRMGLFTEEFRNIYGELYTVYYYGIELCK
jgi:hypothetical protein